MKQKSSFGYSVKIGVIGMMLLFLQPLLSFGATPFKYRSISFGTPARSGPPTQMGTKVTGKPFKGIRLDLNRDMVKRAADLGFNDVTIQTEEWTMPKLEALRKWADKTGNFKFIKDQGMSLSVWVHELNDMPKDIGPLTIDNEKLWTALRERYRYVCNELLPEVDYYVLTVVESQLWVTGKTDVLVKLVSVINEECRKANKKLIFRTFLWYVSEASVIMDALEGLPDDVIVMSKCVPQDWHLRGVDSPFIGKAGKRDQYIEFDIAGEYNKLTHVACAFTDILNRQLKYAEKHNCDGIAVRVDRYGSTCWGQAQEANLWYLGYHSSGKSSDQNKAWHDYAVELFGSKAAPTMIKALRPTGEVVAEAICVEQESFGYSRDVRPMRNSSDPFNVLHSPAKWDRSLVPTYNKIKAGDPEIIKRKTESFAGALASAKKSLRLIDTVKDDLPDGAYEFFRWKLQENEFHLIMFCNIELAWLKDARYRRTKSADEQNILARQVAEHVKVVKQMNADAKAVKISVKWKGKTHNLQRGSYHNWTSWVKRFGDYSATLKVPQKSSELKQLDKVNIALNKPVTASSSQSGRPASNGNDGKDSTRWCAADDKAGHWWQVDLQKGYNLSGCEINWQFGDQLYQYKVQGSANGKNWTMLTDQSEDGEVSKIERHSFKANGIRYVRITVTNLGFNNWASFNEVKLFGKQSVKKKVANKVSPARAIADDQRPLYHLTPPTGRMGDPETCLLWNGKYHFFHMREPKDAKSSTNPMRWDHVVSDDMIRWKHLPPAILPDMPYDNRSIWSGCIRVIDGLPTIFYSGRAEHGVNACMATSTDMINWKKADFNPLMNPQELRRCWDHCVWKEGDTYIMATGGREGVQLFASQDLKKWEYLHPLFAGDPKRGLRKWDCPHLFKVGDKDVVIVYSHPRRHNIYFVGKYENRRFHVEKQGNLDLGVDAGGTFSAANTFLEAKEGQKIIAGFMQERIHQRLKPQIRNKRIWSNALSLPRVLSLGKDNLLRFEPIEQVKSLRYAHKHFANIELTLKKPSFQVPMEDDCLEIIAVIEPGKSEKCGLKLINKGNDKENLQLVYDRAKKKISLNGLGDSLELADGEPLRVRVFIDKSLVEVFVNKKVCLSRWIYSLPADNQMLEVFSSGNAAKVKGLDIWRMKQIFAE